MPGGPDLQALDTPGHAAFTAMRARGAKGADIAVLVVAADDGVMPQTIEAIKHAQAAGVCIIIAMNKMDLRSANPDRLKQQLQENEIMVEDWGGSIGCCPVSAITGEGVDGLIGELKLRLKSGPQFFPEAVGRTLYMDCIHCFLKLIGFDDCTRQVAIIGCFSLEQVCIIRA